MRRNILVGFVGLLLTGILFAIAGWLLLNFSEQGALVKAKTIGAVSNEDFAEAFFKNSGRSILITEAIVAPLISLSVGGFVGLFTRRRQWLPTLIALIPVFLFFLLEPTFRGFFLCVVYTALAIVTAIAINRWWLTRIQT